MKTRPMLVSVPLVLLVLSPVAVPATSNPGGEYSKHFTALSQLSVAVAHAMPADQYGFRPHPDSMDFGQLMSHIATTNYQFCSGLKDSRPPALPSPTDRDGIVKFLSNSFDYCSGIISTLTEAQLEAAHDSPDGHPPGREVLLA